MANPQDDNKAQGFINTDEPNVTIPDDTREKFPQLVERIIESRSMNDEERQYWVDVLPIMSDEQLANLRDILDNEHQQIVAAEENYSKKSAETMKEAKNAFDEAAYLEQKQVRLEVEKKHEEEEAKHEAELLEELAKL